MSVFVTVGAQMPFDRLVLAVDAWARARNRPDVFAQIGEDGVSPTFIEHTRFLSPPDFDAAYAKATLIIAHAGTGSIFAALERGKPIVIMPRRAAMRETRNDHQVATAKRFATLGNIPIAWDEHELPAVLDRVSESAASFRIGKHASSELIQALKQFITKGQNT